MTPTAGPSGTYRPCRVCHAPIIDPFPETWEVEVVKEGPPSGPVKTFITPHAEQCDAPYADPQPGIALRLPGSAVASLAFAPPPPIPTDRAGWVDLGATSEGFTWTHAVDDIDGGQAVAFAGPGRLFVKPYVGSDLDGEPLITDPDETGTFQIAGVSVTAEGRMPPDTIAVLSGLDPGEVLPGESVAQALIRLNRVAAFRLDPPAGPT